MNLRFETLFNISLTSNYYVDGNSHDDLLIYPTWFCHKQMRRFMILAKRSFKGISLVYECKPGTTDSTPRIAITQEEKFVFNVKAKNPGFWYYADVQGWSAGKIYLLKNPVFNTTGDITILNGPLTTPVLYYPLHFKFEATLEAGQSLLEVRNNSNVLIQSIIVRAKLPSEAGVVKEPYFVDLNGQPDGLFTIKHISLAANPDQQVYCSADYAPDVIAVIEITYKTGLAYTGIKPYQNYVIQIASRSTDWFYDVYIRKKAVPVAQASQLSIKHIPEPPNPAITFGVDGVVDNVNGHVQFKSASKLFYSQKPMHLQLLGAANKVLIDPLPLPLADDVKKDAADNLFTKVVVNV